STGCTAWANASLIPGSAAQSIEIQNGHTVHVTDARTGNHITIDAGGDLEVDSGKTFSFNNGASTDMTVNGTFGVSGTAAMSAGTDHIVNGTFVIRSGGAATLFGSGATITVNSGGNFTVASGGSFTPAGSAASLIMIQSGATASIDGPVSGLGNLTVNGTLTSSANITLSAPSDLEVGGTMTLTGSAVLVTAKTGVGVVGNINNGGTLKLQDTAKWGIGNATTAASCSTGGSSCASVNSGGTLDIGPGAVVQGWGGAALNTTDGYLIVASGATLKIGSASGIAAPGTNSGNVQTKNRTFDTGANYTYDGGAANTGTGLPSTVNNLTIANTSGVVTPTGSPQTVNGTLNVTSGSSLQKIGVFTLNLGAGGVSNAGTIELRSAAGCGVIDTITIRSTTTSTQRAWAGAGTFTIADADIKDQAGTAAITALSSTNSGNNGANWNIIAGCTADSTPPTSTITFPTNTTYSSSTWTSGGGAITGTANDNVAVSSVGVSIQDGSGNYWNGSAFGSVTEVFNAATSADSFAHWSYSFPAANMTSGHSYTVRSKATDTSSIAETSPPSVTFTFQNDGTPPTSAITFPVNGTAYNASSWTGSVTGTASDTGGSGLQKVEVQISDTTNSTHFDGTNFVSGATGFITATGPTPWSQTLAAAKLTTGHGYTVTSKATDNAANVESSPPSAGFTYDTTAPTVTIVSASPGTIGAGGTSTVT
ncbi:MAG TPA: hypothetical protein VN903_20060, partial [Polyangia bacterium]|nr:hypothetical protein [Polyangia bacterium]